jgi:transposase
VSAADARAPRLELGKKSHSPHDRAKLADVACELFGAGDSATATDNTVAPAIAAAAAAAVNPGGAARVRRADRSQVGLQYCCIDELVPVDHPVRVIWAAVEQMDPSAFEGPIGSREFTAGRPANDVRVMVGLWLWAATDNVAGGRQLARLCVDHLAYRWMCGGLGMNYHTLNDFRTGHRAALDGLFTATLGRLTHAGLVEVKRITQDGLRVRAAAGAGSFHRRPTLEARLAEAEAHLAELRARQDEDAGEEVNRRRAAAAGPAAAEDRADRVRRALAEMTAVEAAARARPSHESKAKQAARQSRVSTTDPAARVMKMPDGGYDPAHNVQLATDPLSGAIVGVAVTNCGADAGLSEPMRQQVELRTGLSVAERLVDGGYVDLAAVDAATAAGVDLYMPVPQPNQRATVPDRYARRDRDTAAVAAWPGPDGDRRRAAGLPAARRDQRDGQRRPAYLPRHGPVQGPGHPQGDGGRPVVGPGAQPAALRGGPDVRRRRVRPGPAARRPPPTTGKSPIPGRPAAGRTVRPRPIGRPDAGGPAHD